mgnify:CR=1 FL=1
MSTEPAIPTPPPRVARFEKLGFGMFIHWGLYSLLGKGEWILSRGSVPVEDYEKLTGSFTADKFDAKALVAVAREAGMKYACITARHHDGFSLYDTRGLSDYDAPHSAAERDLVGEFVTACRDGGVEIGRAHV